LDVWWRFSWSGPNGGSEAVGLLTVKACVLKMERTLLRVLGSERTIPHVLKTDRTMLRVCICIGNYYINMARSIRGDP